MSGKYEDVRLAYNPKRSDDMRGELLFKVTYQQGVGALNVRGNSDGLYRDFFTGRGGWENSNHNSEIKAALQNSYKALTSMNDAEKKEVVKKMRSLNAGSSDPLVKAAALLFNQVFNVELENSSGAKILLKCGDTNLDENLVGAASAPKITVVAGNFDHITTHVSAVGKSYHIGGTGDVDLSVGSTDGETVFRSWNAVRLLSSGTHGSSGDDLFSALITGTSPSITFENSVRRGSNGELEVNHSGSWQPVDKVRQTMCEAVAANTDCDEILHSCLLADNKDGSPVGLTTGACLGVLAKSTSGLWKATKADVAKMNPKAAFMLLKNLGFKGKKDGNTIKCEPVDEWLERVDKDEMTDDSGKKVPVGDGSTHDHAKVKGYCAAMKDFLELVVGYVDSNPQILNQGSGHSTGSIATNDPFGLKRPQGNNKDGSLSDMRNQAVTGLDHVHVYISGLMAALGQNPLISLSGGAVVPGYLAPSGTAPLKQKVQRFSHRLKEVYDHYVERLNGMNKDLSKATKDKVDSVFETLKEKEDELLKWVEYLERYYEVSTIEGDLTSKRISKKDLEDAYQKYEKNLGKLRKRTVNVIDILATLSNATNDAESGSVNLPSSA